MIVEGLISKGLTILGGSPKIGKSWLALDLAISVANGSPFLGKSVQKTGLAEQKTMLRMMSRAVTTVTLVTAPPPVGRYRHCRHSCH
jgi:predicted ATP-dependent serine protease